MCIFHESHDRIYTELTFLTLKAHITKSCMFFCHLLKYFESSLTNSVDLDQTAPVGAV